MENKKRLIYADDIVKVAEHAFNEWNLAMAASDGDREINHVFKMQELCKAEKTVAENAPTVDAVVLPCKVGDYVYYIEGGYYKSPKFCKVSRPCKIVEVSFKLQRDSGRVLCGFITDNGTRYSFNGIGKTVFLTREEAEAALDRMKG